MSGQTIYTCTNTCHKDSKPCGGASGYCDTCPNTPEQKLNKIRDVLEDYVVPQFVPDIMCKIQKILQR